VPGGFIDRLRERFGAAPARAPRAPDGMRLYAVGDIHGRDDLLAELLRLVEADAAGAPDMRKVLIFLGDYVDRGLQSKAVLDRLTGDPLPGFERIFLKGNHELALKQFMEDAAFGRSWKYYGGLETLHSYGITELTLSDDPADFERARAHFNETIPDKHLEFLDNLALTAEFGDYFFVHAGVRPGIALHRQIEEDLLWIREDFLDSSSTYGKVVVHGHTPREAVEFRPNRIGLDTGAYMTGVLTALVLEGEERRLIQTGGAAAN